MNFFISSAYANGSTQAQQPSMLANFVLIAVFFVIFYFMIWRPQSKRAKEHRELINSLTEGSEIMFSGGLMGRIIKMNDEIVVVEISKGVEVKIQRASVISVLPEGTLNNI